MIWLGALWGVLMLAVGIIVGNRLAKEDPRMVDRLYRDNQSLMEALAKANGQQLQFKQPDVIKAPYLTELERMPARYAIPYWQAKQERTVQVGDRTVTLKS